MWITHLPRVELTGKRTVTIWAAPVLGATWLPLVCWQTAHSQASDRACPAGHARIVGTQAHSITPAGGGAQAEAAPAIILERSATPNEFRLSLTGPVLGAMDSSKVSARIECTPEGIGVIAIVTRSADYQGAVLANVIWQPSIDVLIQLSGPRALLAATWTMRLSTGAPVVVGDTPPNYHQKFPITLSKNLTAQ